jgi:hypothetical protein
VHHHTWPPTLPFNRHQVDHSRREGQSLLFFSISLVGPDYNMTGVQIDRVQKLNPGEGPRDRGPGVQVIKQSLYYHLLQGVILFHSGNTGDKNHAISRSGLFYGKSFLLLPLTAPDCRS